LAAFSVSWSLTQSVGLLGRGISLLQGRYLHTRQHKQNKSIQTSMPWVGFEPMIPAFERAKTVHALDRAATVIGPTLYYPPKSNYFRPHASQSFNLSTFWNQCSQIAPLNKRRINMEIFIDIQAYWSHKFLLWDAEAVSGWQDAEDAVARRHLVLRLQWRVSRSA
jgi:hypothetical protein